MNYHTVIGWQNICVAVINYFSSDNLLETHSFLYFMQEINTKKICTHTTHNTSIANITGCEGTSLAFTKNPCSSIGTIHLHISHQMAMLGLGLEWNRQWIRPINNSTKWMQTVDFCTIELQSKLNTNVFSIIKLWWIEWRWWSGAGLNEDVGQYQCDALKLLFF